MGRQCQILGQSHCHQKERTPRQPQGGCSSWSRSLRREPGWKRDPTQTEQVVVTGFRTAPAGLEVQNLHRRSHRRRSHHRLLQSLTWSPLIPLFASCCYFLLYNRYWVHTAETKLMLGIDASIDHPGNTMCVCDRNDDVTFHAINLFYC